MKRIGKSLASVLLCSPLLLLCPVQAVAECKAANDKIRPSLVQLTLEEEPPAADPITVKSTGFIVSNDGLILTTYQLISGLDEKALESATLTAKAGEPLSTHPVAIVDAAQKTGLLILRFVDADQTYQAVTLGRAVNHDDTKKLFSCGYVNGSLSSRETPQITRYVSNMRPWEGFLWTSDFKFDYLNGENGSPIYEADGTVVGIAMGRQGDAGRFVPIGFADGLIAHIRLRHIASQIKEFDPLRRQLKWEASVDKRSGKFYGTLTYQKSASGEPRVASINVAVTPTGEKNDSNGVRLSVTPIQIQGLKQTADSPPAGGAFEIPDEKFGQRLNSLLEDFAIKDFDEFRFQIDATLTDGTTLRRDTVTIRYGEGK